MSLDVSLIAQAYLDSTNVTPNIVLQIRGIPLIFGAQPILEKLRIGEFVIGDGSIIGGTTPLKESRDWIMLNGTTNNISHQVNIDRALGTSITSFKVSMIDKGGQLTRILSPGFSVVDPLGLDAKVYWMPALGSFPNDAVTLFVGIIDRLEFKQGSVIINVAHPDQLKRQELLPKATSRLTADFNIGDTTLNAENLDGFLPPQESLVSYARINDEVIRFESIAGTQLLSCTRAQLGTVENDHDIDDDIESFYVLNGKSFDLSLKLLLSGGDEFFADLSAPSLVQVDPLTSIPGAIFFDDFNIRETLGLVNGDIVVISNSVNPANNLTTEIVGFGQSSLGSYIVVPEVLISEPISTATVQFKSKYNVLNFGCALRPEQVDVAQFERLDRLVGSSHPELNIYIKDTINASDFLDQELYFPVGIYSVPRKGRISCNVTVPPIAQADTVTLDATNISNAKDLSVQRTTNERFFNAVVYQYSVDSLEDRFLSARITQSATSTNRIRVGNKFLTIESNGLRDSATVQNLIDVQSRRFLDRYQFGAEKVNVQTPFSSGFRVEVGDTVILDGTQIGLSDTKNGTRNFLPRIMEVTNKSMNLKNGDVRLEITDTGYSANARYGTWAPSSIIGEGSTAGLINLVNSYSTGPLESESNKWQDYINQRIIIRTEDWSYVEETRVAEIIATTPNQIRVSPAVTPPAAGLIVDVPNYDESEERQMRLYKTLHCSWNKQDQVISGTNSTFEVVDTSFYRLGLLVRIHLPDYSEDIEASISEINGNIISISTEAPFAITSSHLVEALQYRDGGNYYAFF